MKKKVLNVFIVTVFLFFSFSALSFSAQLKALVVIADDYVDESMNTIADSCRLDLTTVKRFLNMLKRNQVVDVEVSVLQGREASKRNILEAAQDLTAANDDIVMFYFSGHGGMTGRRNFLNTCDDRMLYRDEIERIFNGKSARLKIVITDACSSYIDEGRSEYFPMSFQYHPGMDINQIYHKLFFEYQGLLSLASASDGEYAWCGNNGSVFTKSFFDQVLIRSPKDTWQEIFRIAKESTQQEFKNMIANGEIDYQTLNEMRSNDITSQTPKYFSMPVATVFTPDNSTDNNEIDNTIQERDNNSSDYQQQQQQQYDRDDQENDFQIGGDEQSYNYDAEKNQDYQYDRTVWHVGHKGVVTQTEGNESSDRGNIFCRNRCENVAPSQSEMTNYRDFQRSSSANPFDGR